MSDVDLVVLIEESLKFARAGERLQAILELIQPLPERIGAVAELGVEIDPELRAAIIKTVEVAEHLRSAFNVLDTRFQLVREGGQDGPGGTDR